MESNKRVLEAGEQAVAVVGISAILPDAPDAASFWKNVVTGRDSIREVPRERWRLEDFYDPDPAVPDKTYCKIGAFVSGFSFDSTKFRIPPPVATAMDVVQQWMLVCAREALLDAGHPDGKLDPERIGVVLGNALGGELYQETTMRLTWPAVRRALEAAPELAALGGPARAALEAGLKDRYLAGFPPIHSDSMPGELGNVIAGRVCNALDLRGPNFTTDAACASSLAALDTAMSILALGKADAVVTGGVDRTMSPSTFIKFAKIGALSPDGSRPFDAGANGFVMGEGCVALVLRRLADAERDGQRIYAVIRSVGASSDGRGKGITAPNPKGQILAVKRAYELAGVSPATVGLIEAHGTSTRVGDAAETEALASVFGGLGLPAHSVALGSVKSQIGHLKSGAGAAGLLKAILAIHHQTLPPTINVKERNPGIPWDKLPLYPSLTAQPWERRADGPRRAAVSSFGFGGTNFHVVLEEHVPGLVTGGGRKKSVSVPAEVKSRGEGILLLGAATVPELRTRAAAAGAEAARTAATLAVGAQDLAAHERLAVAYGSPEELAAKLREAVAALDSGDPRAWKLLRGRGIHRGTGPAPKVAFLFPGQGSQTVGMLQSLREREPEVGDAFVEADAAMAELLPAPLSSYVFTRPSPEADTALRDTRVCQPAMLAADAGLLALLGRYGMKPDLVIGHSLGEYAALVAAGSLPFADAVKAVSARAREMTSVSIADNGKMASIFAPTALVDEVLAEVGGGVVTANFNSRNQTVIGGPTAAVEAAVERFTQRGVKAVVLPVSHAFHTSIVAPASAPLRVVLEKIGVTAPRLPVISNVTAEPYPAAASQQTERLDLLAKQIAAPVQFLRGLETLYRLGARIFVEVGPRKVLASFVEDVLADRADVVALCTNQPKLGDRESFTNALAGLYAAGCGLPLVHEPAHDAAPAARTLCAPAAARLATLAPSAAPGAPAMTSRPFTPGPASDATHLALGRAFSRFLEESLSLYQQGAPATAPAPVTTRGSVVVSGAALGLPGRNREIFAEDNVERILRGESFIDALPDATRLRLSQKGIVRVAKGRDGSASFEAIENPAEVLKLAGQGGSLDLAREFGLDAERLEAFDQTTRLAVGAALLALRDAGIPLVRRYKQTSRGSFLPDRWVLPEALADETGVIFGSAFPGYESLMSDLEKFHADKTLRARLADLQALQLRLDGAAARIVAEQVAALSAQLEREHYTFDRRFLFRILAMGHSQVAELIGARGPNVQVNAACASAGAALTVAEDWIRSGRCRRVLVLSADDAGSGHLFDWVGAGMLATGAATTEGELTKAALPFDRRRNGMIVGMGASGLVVESEDAVRERGMHGLAEVMAVESCNSAFHGTRLDVDHIGQAMERLVGRVEQRFGIGRDELAREGVFVSHETYTPARGGSAAAEIHSLRRAFGPHASELVIANTKGFTGHAMGAGIEEAVAVKILETGIVPPVPNLAEPDPELGDLRISKGGKHDVRYAVRLAAGFGSQLVITALRKLAGPRVDEAAHRAWVEAVSGRPGAALVVEHKSLRVRDDGPPRVQPAPSRWVPGTGPTLEAEPAARVGQALASSATLAAAAPPHRPAVAEPAASPAADRGTPVAAAAAPATSPVVDKLLGIVATKAGYPREMLALDLDLEADLGIDAVKQAEIFSELRTVFELPKRDDLKLRDYPTLGHLARLVGELRPDLAAAAAPAPAAMVPGPLVAEPPGAWAEPASGAAPSAIVDKLLGIVAAKAGYPREMLALDLDLEADLGIDTVKQAEIFSEIRTGFELPRRDDLKLRDYPTLGHLARLIGELRPDLAPTRAPAAAPHADDVADRLLDVVATATGYPRDMLALDLDLEADLGIDTVKQAEIFTKIRAAFELERKDGLALRDYPTLGHLIGLVKELRAAHAQPAAAVAPEATASSSPASGEPFKRRVPVPVLRPELELCKATGVALVKGRRVAVVLDAAGAGEALAALLEARGVGVVRVDGSDADTQAKAIGEVDGLYDLSALDPEPALIDGKADEVRAALRARYGRLSRLCRGLYASLQKPGAFVVAATRLGGLHGYGSEPALAPMGGAVTGFVKAIGRELPGLLAKAVDFEADAEAARIATVLLQETERDPEPVEVGHAFGARHAIGLLETALPVDRSHALGSGSVVLVTGAAGGITAAIAATLARESRASFFLTDIVPEPAADGRDRDRVASDRDGLKRERVERAKATGERVTPAQIEAKLAALEREAALVAAMKGITDAGGKVTYRSSDVRDAGAVAALVQEAAARSGRIDAILHAAGLERSRSLADKPLDELERVFEVKALGLASLLAATKDVPVGAIVCFSSVAGRFGNAGQVDYSAANDFLCKTMSALPRLKPETRGLAIDWTAWGELGMATRGSIPEIMRRAGIDMLPLSDGLPVVGRELAAGSRGEFVAARALGILVASRDAEGGVDVTAITARAAQADQPMLGRVVSMKLHEGLRIETTLDPRTEPFLKDHAIDGVPVLPGVMGVEGFVEVSRLLLPDHRVVALEDVRFEAPFKFHRGEPRDCIFRAQLRREAAHVLHAELTLSSTQTLPNGEVRERRHFSGTVRLERSTGTAKAKSNGKHTSGKRRAEVSTADVYQVFFHGPAYQVLGKVEATERGARGKMRSELPPALSAGGVLFAPRAIELCLQTAGVYELGTSGRMALPAGISRVVSHAVPDEGTELTAEIEPRDGAGGAGFDARVVDAKGRLYLELEGYRTSALPVPPAETLLAPMRDAFKRERS